MNLIEKIEELRELEPKSSKIRTLVEQHGFHAGEEIIVDKEYIYLLYHIAPGLLTALDFRPGDADRLLDFMEYIGENCESPEEYAYLEMLKRLHGMARKMEPEEKG